MSGIIDWISGWKTAADTDPLQIGDAIRITISFQNIPGLGPNSDQINNAFLEYCDLQVSTISDVAGSLSPGESAWQVVGTMLDNCSVGTTKGQAYAAMNAVSSVLSVPIMGVEVIGIEIGQGSPSNPDVGLVGALNTTAGGSAESTSGVGLGLSFSLAMVAIIVVAIAYLAGFFKTRQSI